MLQVLVLERVKPEDNIHRYYVLAIEPTLFGDIALRRECGRLGQRGGALHADAGAAKEAFATCLRRKQTKQYAKVADVATLR